MSPGPSIFGGVRPVSSRKEIDSAQEPAAGPAVFSGPHCLFLVRAAWT